MMRRISLALLALALLHPSGPARAAGHLKLRALAPIYSDSKGTPLSAPESAAFGAGSLLAVADTGSGRIVMCSVTAEGITPTAEFAVAEAPYPIRIKLTSKGELLVLDGRSRKIARVASTGEFKGYIDTGNSPGIRAIALDRSDRLYVLDVSAPRILMFDAAGKAAGETPLPASAGFFSDLVIDARGDVFALDSVGSQVYVVRAGASEASKFGVRLVEELDFATSLAVTRSGHLFLVDQHGGGIVILGPDGSFQGRQSAMGWREGFLRYPSDISYDDNAGLYIADRGNNRVQVFAISQ